MVHVQGEEGMSKLIGFIIAVMVALPMLYMALTMPGGFQQDAEFTSSGPMQIDTFQAVASSVTLLAFIIAGSIVIALLGIITVMSKKAAWYVQQHAPEAIKHAIRTFQDIENAFDRWFDVPEADCYG